MNTCTSNSPADVRAGGAGEWSPIEKAPKDAAQKLFYDGGIITIGHWSLDRKRWVDLTDPQNEYTFTPTHWQPLPPAPAPQEGGV